MDRELRVVLSARVFSDQKCFGPGVSQLLKRVDELHSLRAAALSIKKGRGPRRSPDIPRKSRSRF